MYDKVAERLERAAKSNGTLMDRYQMPSKYRCILTGDKGGDVQRT